MWGVGRRYTAHLAQEGVYTAADLAALPTDAVRARYGVVLARTQTELRGIPCGDLELEEPDRKQIVVSRMFGRDVGDPFDALATFATVACEKMRGRGLAAGALWVWLDGNPHKGNGFHVSRAVLGEVTSGSDRTGASARLRRFTGLGGCFCKLQRCGETWIGCLVNSRCGHL